MPVSGGDCSITYKVLVLGDHGVGKTAILDQLVGRGYKETWLPTVGVDFVRKVFEVDGALIQLFIWDTAGQERFRSITRRQFKGVQGIVLVYDVTNEESFHSLKYWMQHFNDTACNAKEGYEPVPFVVCGNKSDLLCSKKISTRAGMKLAEKEMAFGFYETSAKSGTNIFAALHGLAFHITDICNPKLMKSYYPYRIRPPDVVREATRATNLCSDSESFTPLPNPSKSSSTSSKTKWKKAKDYLSKSSTSKSRANYGKSKVKGRDKATKTAWWFRRARKGQIETEGQSSEQKSAQKTKKKKKKTDKGKGRKTLLGEKKEKRVGKPSLITLLSCFGAGKETV